MRTEGPPMGQLMLPGMDHQPSLPGMDNNPAQGQLAGLENRSSEPTHHIVNPRQFGSPHDLGFGKPKYKQPKAWSAKGGVVTWNE